MTRKAILKALDLAMTALEAARTELAGELAQTNGKVSAAPTAKKSNAKPGSAKRGISEEGRQRIAEAQRKRWAVKKRAAKKAARLAAQ